MTFVSITRKVPMLAVIGLLPSAFAAGATADHRELEKEGIQLIYQVEEVARDVRYHAGRLNSFVGVSLVSNWSHTHHIEQIKEFVNEGLSPALLRLAEIQPQLPDWKQQSIDKMLEAAKTLAADTTSAILEQKATGARPLSMNTEYKEFITRMYAHAEALVKLSDAAGTYASARSKASKAGVKVPQP
jgi:hypothetical protein